MGALEMQLERLTPRMLRSTVAAVALLVAILGLVLEPEPVEITFAYSTDAEDLLTPLVDRFNDGQDDVSVTQAARPSGDVLQGILAGEEIDLWMPAASSWGRLLNYETGAEMAPEGSPTYFWSPEVIGTFDAVLDDFAIDSWADIADLATGRESLGDGEVFRLGHTKPTSSTSGLYALVSEFASVAGGRRLIVDDRSVIEVRTIEQAVLHYGDVADDFCDRLFDYSSAYVDAFYMQETTFLKCKDRYPDLGLQEVFPDQTFIADYPAFVLNAPWVTEQEAEAANTFLRWLNGELETESVLEERFRRGDPWDRDGTAGDRTPEGADRSQRWEALAVPAGNTLASVLNVWPEVRKPSTVLILLEKGDMHVDSAIDSAKELLRRFIADLPDGATVGLDSFDQGHPVTEAPLDVLDDRHRGALLAALEGIGASGADTYLADALMDSIDEVEDRHRIALIVLVSLGPDRADGRWTLDDALAKLSDLSHRTSPVQVFTISFGRPNGDRALDAIATRSLGSCADAKGEDDDGDRCESITAAKLLDDVSGIV